MPIASVEPPKGNVPRLTHKLRRDRREKMAMACKDRTMGEVAREFEVSIESVRRACIEFDVDGKLR